MPELRAIAHDPSAAECASGGRPIRRLVELGLKTKAK
jgi:hypothetical protein